MTDAIATTVFVIGLAALGTGVAAMAFGLIRWSVRQIVEGLGLRSGDRHE